MKRRILSVLVMVIVLVMLLVACGDKKDPVTTEKPDTPSTDSSSGGEVKPSVEPIRVGVVTTLSGCLLYTSRCV